MPVCATIQFSTAGTKSDALGKRVRHRAVVEYAFTGFQPNLDLPNLQSDVV